MLARFAACRKALSGIGIGGGIGVEALVEARLASCAMPAILAQMFDEPVRLFDRHPVSVPAPVSEPFLSAFEGDYVFNKPMRENGRNAWVELTGWVTK